MFKPCMLKPALLRLLQASILFLAAPAAAAAPTAAEMPMLFYGTRPAVAVRVNGQGPFFFLIDTGAAGAPLRIDAALARRLSLRPTGSAAASDASGAAAAVDRLTVARVEIPGLSATDVEALSRDYGTASYLPKIDGILGYEFFRGKLLTLDFAHKKVRIAAGRLPPADGLEILDLIMVEGNPCVRATIGGRRAEAIFDTGNIRGIDLPSLWLKSMRLASWPRTVGSSGSVSGTVPLREVTLAEPLLIGRYRFERPSVTFADEYQEANIGATIWQGFTITLDVADRRVRLRRPR
jgi:hypothetical protein